MNDLLHEDVNFIKKSIFLFTLFLMVVSGVLWFFTRSTRIIEDAFIKYEDFQEIYNTCFKINYDLDTIKSFPENDKMFSQFSKSAMIAAKKQQMTR